eukprot:TRINITY_DN1182_c0_g1_i1.p1 TRINITY_DN1182_c0_g1~~TRINITY_DN1182_c0_g1_i1.p1  ORF type:complete len:446 (+),score=79.53 TRINITY_DN1182_c0_g1_i1:32-1339(+)
MTVKDCPEFITIEENDTIFDICFRYNVTQNTILQLNGFVGYNSIYPGQIIRLKPSKELELKSRSPSPPTKFSLEELKVTEDLASENIFLPVPSPMISSFDKNDFEQQLYTSCCLIGFDNEHILSGYLTISKSGCFFQTKKYSDMFVFKDALRFGHLDYPSEEVDIICASFRLQKKKLIEVLSTITWNFSILEPVNMTYEVLPVPLEDNCKIKVLWLRFIDDCVIFVIPAQAYFLIHSWLEATLSFKEGIPFGSTVESETGNIQTNAFETNVQLHSSVITVDLQKKILAALPKRLRARDWKVVYDTAQEGMSLPRLLHTIRNISKLLLVIQTKKSNVLGAYIADMNSNLFNSTCFVFDNEEVYKYAHNNNFIIAFESGSLTIGYGNGNAIFIRETLAIGHSSTSNTFNNPCLVKKNSITGETFKINRLFLYSLEVS